MDATVLFHQDIFLKFFIALLALVNPLYGIPIFLSMTDGYTPAERYKTALVVTGTVITTCLVSVLIGEEILRIFQIQVSSVRIAGGIIILGIALNMLRAAPPSKGDASAAAAGHSRKRNIAIVPLAIPLTVGPGAIATSIVFAHQLTDFSEVMTLVPAVLAVGLCLGLGLRFATPIAGFLGTTGISVISRIMAIILASVSVEMILSGTFAAIDQHYPALSASDPGS